MKIENILHPFKSFRAGKNKRNLKRMIKEAKRLHLKNGKQYHVFQDEKQKLHVLNNDQMKAYNKESRLKINGVQRRIIALYSTPLDGLLLKLDKCLNND